MFFVKFSYIHNLLAMTLSRPFVRMFVTSLHHVNKNTSWKSVLSPPSSPSGTQTHAVATNKPSSSPQAVSCFLCSKFFFKCSEERERDRERVQPWLKYENLVVYCGGCFEIMCRTHDIKNCYTQYSLHEHALFTSAYFF
jgi:hypothetical protein